MNDIDRTPGEVAARDYLAKRRALRPLPWFVAGWILGLIAIIMCSLAGAAVSGKAIEKAAFYQINSERGW